MRKKLLVVIFFLVSVAIYSQESSSLKDLSTYPNPFSNQTEISFKSNKEQPVTLNIKNILGKTVYSEKLIAKDGKNTFQFRRNDLNAGMYIYSIQTYKEVISKRFVIK